MTFKVVILSLSVFICSVAGRSVDIRSALEGYSAWGYEDQGEVLGPNSWYKSYKFCAGTKQSPINIENPRKLQVESSLHLGGYNRVVGSLTNNGHSATFNVDKSQGTMTILKGRLQLEQFHYHFGCSDEVGSEHTVNGMSYPAEVHFVFFNTKYKTIQEAQDKRDGLLVVGSFLELLEKDDKDDDDDDDDDNDEIDDFDLSFGNEELSKLTDLLPDIKQPGSSIPIESPIDLTRLVPALEDDDDISFYMYPGSLTTPPCYESVKWMVLKETASISYKQLEMFRTLYSDHGPMCNNFRPVQPANGRRVFELKF